MSALRVSVGPGKPNFKADVLLVQRLLNASAARLQMEPLKLDGVFGPKTAADILAYQALILGIRQPSGVVDPGELTIRSLARGGSDGPEQTAGRNRAIQRLVSLAKPLAARPADVETFVQFALPAARQVKASWGVPVSLVLAHSGLTTGWGQHVTGNAYFGIKGRRVSPEGSSFAAFEVIQGRRLRAKAVFREYSDYADAADDYGRILARNPVYRPAFSYARDAFKFAEFVATAWSANYPQNAALVTRIMRFYGLTEFDEEAAL